MHAMKKIFFFDSPSDPYSADATVLCCFDGRFGSAIDEFLRTQQIRMPDIIVVAGGTKTLASPSSDFEREFIIQQIRLSLELHRAKRVVLINHSDCGAYGGSVAFQHDAQIEAEYHAQELQTAVTLVAKILPTITVEAYFLNFEGVLQVNPT
jgi:carbonic anhydrase